MSTPVEPTPVYPPKVTEWLPPFIPPYDVPGIIVPPPVTPTPPCNPKTDPECPPPPPPDDVPEPATWIIVLVGIIGAWLIFRRKPKGRVE